MEKRGAVLSGLVALAALGALGFVFVQNASPYLTVAQAKTSSTKGVHVAGQIQKNSIVNDVMRNQIRFTLTDTDGQVLPVVYTGTPVSNLNTATKVVAVGGMDHGLFRSDQLLVKCPSKYEATKPTL